MNNEFKYCNLCKDWTPYVFPLYTESEVEPTYYCQACFYTINGTLPTQNENE